jgi:uncharacterized membrane protein YcaP (DUF421 family)
MGELLRDFHRWIGSELQPKDFTFFQVVLRGVIVFIASLVMVRLADKRFFAKKSAFDVILGFILASMLARAVNGSASFFPSLGGGFVLVALHRLLGAVAFRHHLFGVLVKGSEEVLVEDGRMQIQAMRKTHISKEDLLEDLRLNGQMDRPEDVATARLERSGEISVIPQKK